MAESEAPDWSGRVALITGGQGAIGSAIADDLRERGVSVHVADPSAGDAADPGPRSPVPHRVDVGQEHQVEELVAGILAEEGRLDFLVHAAGVFQQRPFAEIGEEWQRTLRINLTGAFLCLRAVLPAMRRRRSGSVVLISSMLARTGAIGGAHYAASKAGLLGLARTAALENAEHGIRVNTVSPGVTDTPQPRGHLDEDQLAELARTIPLGRIATPADVADATTFLLSSQSSYLTGQDLRLNGGRALW